MGKRVVSIGETGGLVLSSFQTNGGTSFVSFQM